METDERKEAGRGRGLHMAVSEKGSLKTVRERYRRKEWMIDKM